MKLITIDKLNAFSNATKAILTHNEEDVEWNIGFIEKTNYVNSNDEGGYDLFTQLNGYWESLPKAKQDQIFAIYKQIRHVFDEYYETAEMTMRLQDLVSEFYHHHNLEDMHHWIFFHSDVIIPNTINLHDTFTEDPVFQSVSGIVHGAESLQQVLNEDTSSNLLRDKNYLKEKERTYVKSDYKWLITLTIALRAMIPIWGEFISLTKAESGTKFKEDFAFKLLSKASIMHSAPMEKLRVYVARSIPAERSPTAVLKGVSSQDLPNWILGLAIVRRLSVVDVRGVNPNLSIIAFISAFVGQKVKGYNTGYTGMVKKKIPESQNNVDAENNLSKLEGYKIRQDVPDGHIAIIAHQMENYIGTAQTIFPQVDLELLEQAMVSVRGLQQVDLNPAQIILTQWILKPVIPPKGFLYFNKPLALSGIAVAQTLLWQKGYHELAGLISAIERETDEELMLEVTESRSRIQKEQIEQLDVLYPPLKKQSGNRQKLVRRTNQAVEAIEAIANQFVDIQWILTLPADWITQIPNHRTNRRFSAPFDIKVKLANLAISLAQRTF